MSNLNLPADQQPRIDRRRFVSLAGGVAAVQLASAACGAADPPGRAAIYFTSQGRTGRIDPDGRGLRYFEFDVPGQATWQAVQAFPDGRRILFLSMEPRRDGPGRPFDEYYTQTPTHIWVYDTETEALEEICTRQRLAPFETPALLVGERILVQVVKDRVGQIYSMQLDGSDPRPFTAAGEGLPYGFSLSPDGRRVAFHLAGPEGYQVWTADVDGTNRTRIAADPAHLYFGTSWSPDGKWILFVDCRFGDDPGHDWADVCLGRADGGGHRLLTSGQSMWFAATYGDPTTRGGGSNLPAWTPQGQILYPRRLAGSRPAWQYRTGQRDVDHFNREFRPDLARGGSEIWRLDPATGEAAPLTSSDPPAWDFRAAASPDGGQIAFCRAPTGRAPALWVMNADGSAPRRLTGGIDDRGADHPRWIG